MRALALLLALAALPLEAAVATRRIELKLERRPVVLVVHRYGDVNVTGSDRAEPQVTAWVRVDDASAERAEALAGRVRLVVSGRGDTDVVTTVYPAGPQNDPGLSLGADIELDLPSASGVVVRNSFGDVSLAEVSGPCRLENRFGDVEAMRVGDLEIASRYGKVRLEETRGRLLVNSSYGDVKLAGLDDSSRIDNRFGSVELEDSRRHALVHNLWGDVIVVPGGGAVSVANRWGDVVARVERPEVAALNLVSLGGDVRLAVARGVPFQLNGQARQGNAHAPRSIVVSPGELGQVVFGRLGTGGPLIEVGTVLGDIEVEQK
jgi:hypothetical protein